MYWQYYEKISRTNLFKSGQNVDFQRQDKMQLSEAHLDTDADASRWQTDEEVKCLVQVTGEVFLLMTTLLRNHESVISVFLRKVDNIKT